MQNTSEQYDAVIKICRDLFHKKMKDYGSAWRILRLPSLTDQIYIKAQRIRSLQENEIRKVDEGERSEFIGIIGKLGGHLGRKSDGPPGPQQVWQGLARVRDFAMAWKAYEDD